MSQSHILTAITTQLTDITPLPGETPIELREPDTPPTEPTSVIQEPTLMTSEPTPRDTPETQPDHTGGDPAPQETSTEPPMPPTDSLPHTRDEVVYSMSLFSATILSSNLP